MFACYRRPAQQANVTRKPSTVDRLFPDNEVIQRVVGDSRYEETTEIECPAQRFLLLRKKIFFPHLENRAAFAATSRSYSEPSLEPSLERASYDTRIP